MASAAVFNVDSVSVYEIKNKTKTSYRIRWYTADKKQQSLSVKILTIARHIALQIAQDIELGIHHPRDYYDPKKSLEKQIIDHKYNLLNYLWEEWEKLDHNYSESSLLTHRRIRQVLTLVNDDSLHLSNAHDFLTEYRKMYSDGTIYRDMAVIVACVNYWVRVGKVKFNPYPAIKSQLKTGSTTSKKDTDNKGRFTSKERAWVLTRFIDFGSEEEELATSYYNLIKFLFLTGLRPSEVIPLTWDDIDKKNPNILHINKTLVKGHLRHNTKQGKKDNIVHRKYVMNNEVRHFLLSIKQQEKESANRSDLIERQGIIFPSPNNTYINWLNFARRHWRPVINKLVAEGHLRKYLKPYCMRHTYITNEINKGTPLHRVSAQCGTSIEMITRTYLINNDWWIDDTESNTDLTQYDSYIKEYSK